MAAFVLGISTEGRTSTREYNPPKREYTRVYRVQTTLQTDDSDIVSSAIGIPRPWFPWVTARENDLTALCVAVDADQVSPYMWNVTCRFSTDVGLKQDGNPLQRPARIRFTHVMRQKIGEYEPAEHSDSDNKDYVELKGILPSNFVEPFDPPALIDEAIPVLTITRNEADINPGIVPMFVNHVNRDVFFGFAPRQCKMQNISVSTEYTEFGVVSREVEYEIHVHPETWDLQVLDVGTKYWLNGFKGRAQDEVPIPFKDKDGQPCRGLLDGNGGKLAVGEKAVFRKFKVYDERDFSQLNLPQEF